MIINGKILVKAIVTEDFKKGLTEEVQSGISKLDAELRFIEQRAKKTLMELTIKASPQAQSVREQIEYEKKKREEARASLLEQLKKIATLEEGTQVVQGEVEGPVEIKVGDSWEKLFNREIVLKDNVIVEIR